MFKIVKMFKNTAYLRNKEFDKKRGTSIPVVFACSACSMGHLQKKNNIYNISSR